MSRLLILLLTIASGRSAAAELARWDAGAPPSARGISVAANYTFEEGFAHLPPSTDYYRRAAFDAKIDANVALAPGPVWLSIEFLDRGYAQISVAPGVPMQRQWGTVRVNSGRTRTAVLRYDKLDPGQTLRIEGVDRLRSLSLSGSEPPHAYAPLVEPALHFSVPSQRVTTAAGDARSPAELPEAIAGLRNLLPLARALGFNGIETYVRWGFVERQPGVYDWSFYDAHLDEIEKHGLQWFPMLLAGSGYALPAWFHDSPENRGFVCLEHGETHDTQSIFCGLQDKYAQRFIAEFGKRYGGRKGLLGIRLGPSGDYGEAQYPARGPGYQFRAGHTHIGYWAGDACAQPSFRKRLRAEYSDIAALNQAWDAHFPDFDAVRAFLPVTARTPRQRIDFADWYMNAMSAWCELWAQWARQALPHAVIHQSSGGWGPVEIGTDYSYQARSMARLHGGMRLTNESDNFPDNFSITRMASSAARFYGAALGYEPGGFGSARGVMARLFNTLTNGGEHLFYYHGNLTANDQAIDAWLEHGRLMDRRAKPAIDVAAFYPDTALKLDDDVLRYRWASAFLTKARALRGETDFDYASEQMILDGALDRFKVLVFLWGTVTEQAVIERIDRWVQSGGIVIYPAQPRGLLTTVDGDGVACRRWQSGQTGKGRAIFYPGDAIPAEFYARFIRGELRKMDHLRPAVRDALRMENPPGVYWSVLENGATALLNFSDDAAGVRWPSGRISRLKPYAIEMR